MHWLSDNYRGEFLATPQLVRFDYAQGKDGFEPTLLIKGDNLILKYLIKGTRMQLVLARVNGDRLLYGLKVFDDPDKPGNLWSVLEREQERDALFALARGERCQAFLFNELAVNMAWAELAVDFSGTKLGSLAAYAALGDADHASLQAAADSTLDDIHFNGATDPDRLIVDLPGITDWHRVRTTLITNLAGASDLNIFDLNEGRQQEKVVAWLTDNLFPTVSLDQPQIMMKGLQKELTDALLSYQYGTFLFESKALAILGRPTLPDRPKLSRNIIGHIEKAAKQLKGAIRKIKAGTEVTDISGKVWKIERGPPIHAVILVPDLHLLEGDFGFELMCDFTKVTGGYLHIVDPSELLRIVQAAAMIAKRSKTVTPMMAFDTRLIARFEQALESRRLNLEIITRFENEPPC
ncbi:MAG: hypothetical protein V4574_05585 [Pseudomonadota bacterium]